MTIYFKLIISASLILLSNACTSQSVDTSNNSSQSSSEKIVYLSYKKTGDLLPISQVTTIDGQKIDLTTPKKRKLIILFATWCSDSQRAFKALKQSDILKDPELEIIAIAREHTIDEVKEFKQKNNLQLNMVADPKREIYKLFANAGIPRFIMVGKDNKIIDHVVAEGENQLDKIHWN